LQAADAVLVIGSDDADYSASKVYPCVLSQRPILAVMHRQSAAAEVIRRCRAGEVVAFEASDAVGDLAASVRTAIERLMRRPRRAEPETDWTAFAPYTAREMTRRQCEVFDRVKA
jgi:hypothetical protein